MSYAEYISRLGDLIESYKNGEITLLDMDIRNTRLRELIYAEDRYKLL